MSIWASHETEVPCLTYAEGFSNHYPLSPTPTHGNEPVELPARIDFASIPGHCVPGHDDDEWATVGEYLRLGVYAPDSRNLWLEGGPDHQPVCAAVVLDEKGVTALVAELSTWLEVRRDHGVNTTGDHRQ